MNVGLSAEVRYHWFREHLVVVGDWHRLSPSERDRLRHQPMPDEAAQSLRVDLSPWSCGMVFSELLGADLTRFGLCYLAPAEVPASDLTRLGRRLREEFPLLDSQVDSGAEGFELVVHGQPEESPALEVGPFADENALIAALLQRPHSLFERGLLRLFHGRCGGRARWGVWLHHLVADADFASVLLARLAVLNADPTTEAAAPEFGFLQQQWRLERQLRERRTRLEDYWSERGEAFRELASLPWAERASHCEDFRLAATPGGGEAALLTRLACALALALASQGATGKVLALTPEGFPRYTSPLVPSSGGGEPSMRILLVEDHPQLAESVVQALKGAGWTVDLLQDGVAADLALASEEYALAILDVGLPRMDGFEVLARLRGRGKTLPVLMLTARGEVKDRVHGLNLGADDYLAKPFELSELEARVKALLRRSVLGGEQLQRCGALVYDLGTRRFSLDEQPLTLTSREQAVLEAMIARPGRVMSKEQLAAQVFGLDEEASADAIEIYVHRLRKKLEGGAVRIVTFRGLGYLLEAQGD